MIDEVTRVLDEEARRTDAEGKWSGPLRRWPKLDCLG